MTAAIVVQVFRFGFLLLLWLFIYAAFKVIKADLFGSGPQRVSSVPRRGPAPARQPKRRGPRSPTRLVVTGGALTGTTITLGSQAILIGRADDSTLVLTDDFASSRHARLTSREGDWYVEDLGSTNGTYLDRSKVGAPMLVPPGAPIRIGKTVLELRA
ncbi:FHA domain-containing protein [soil metagenome]